MRLVSGCLTGLFAPCVCADVGDSRLAPVGAQSLFETLGGLLLIIALIVTAAWLLKRYTRLPIAGKGLISVLGGISIGPRERVVVLKVDNARLVIGVTPGQIRTLHVLDGEQGVDAGFKNRLAAAQSDVEAEAEQ